jgi:NDP-sugar pyrophosphorylase family protein
MLTGYILAAGFGTRLRPLSDHIPKALTTVCGKPLLERSLEFYRQNNINRIGVNAHHFPERLESFRRTSNIPFELFHEKDKIRGTGGALFYARDFLASSETFFVSNVDIIAQIDLNTLYEQFLSYDCSAALIAVARRAEGSIRYDRKTKSYGGAFADPSATGDCGDFIGMAFYKKEFLQCVEKDDFSILPVWTRALKMGHAVKVIEARDIYWKDAGTPRTLAQIHFDVLGKRLALSTPLDLVIDFDKRRAYPRAYSPEENSALGSDVWCEAESIPKGILIEKSVIMKDAEIPLKGPINNTILTPWGAIKID